MSNYLLIIFLHRYPTGAVLFLRILHFINNVSNPRPQGTPSTQPHLGRSGRSQAWKVVPSLVPVIKVRPSGDR